MPNPSTNFRVALIPIALLAAVSIGSLQGCAHSNAHGYQDLPHVFRLESKPVGAQMKIVGRNMFFNLPADIELSLRPDEIIHVSKEGYHTFRGRVGELPRGAQNNYFVILRPIIKTQN